ncbi:MAG: hypothetical protein KDA87_06775 [Planctomycetales bacterium]|nr:hypothetical protein [Planctomycetales bacterium]
MVFVSSHVFAFLFPLIFAASVANRLWYALPLIVSISLVYAATRHELMRPIVEHAVRFSLWIVGFMIGVFIFLTVISALV